MRAISHSEKQKRKSLMLDIIFIMILIIFDQFTKYLAVLKLKDKAAFKIIDGVLELNYLENKGAAFGMMQNQGGFFVFVAVIVLGVIAYILYKTPNARKYTLMHVLLSLIAAGAIGNMIDRIRLDYVVDFIYIILINFPIFNVADMYVSFSTVILVLALLFYYKESDLSFISFNQKKIPGIKVTDYTLNRRNERLSMKEFTYKIDLEEEEERIDKWISNTLQSLSRSYIQKLIKENNVFVNGRAQKASYRIKADDEIRFRIPDASQPSIPAENIPLSILYEDEDILIVDKPKGMVVHPAPGHYSGTLVNAVMFYCKDNLSGINGILRPGIVHRIDKDTTGSLIICKNDAAHQFVASQLKEHSITRKYRAIVHGRLDNIPDRLPECPTNSILGKMSANEGRIDAPIGRDEKDRKKMAVNEKNGKRAVTHYKVLKTFREYSYIECRLETGRTHQIRVHMASIGHPLLGDMVYGGRKTNYHLEGQTLHAMTIGLNLPSTGEYLEVSAPLPAYFEHLLEILE